MYPKHDEDFYGWTLTTVNLLKQGKYQEVDMDRIIEEIETLGRSQKRELVSRSGVLIAHLLKWQYQPSLRCASWEGTIERQRIEIEDLLEENPSLKSYICETLPKAYRYALSILKEETPLDLKIFAKECPYTFKEIVTDDFYPSS